MRGSCEHTTAHGKGDRGTQQPPPAPCHKHQNSLGPDTGIMYNLLRLGLSLQSSTSLTFFLGSLIIAQCRETLPSRSWAVVTLEGNLPDLKQLPFPNPERGIAREEQKCLSTLLRTTGAAPSLPSPPSSHAWFLYLGLSPRLESSVEPSMGTLPIPCIQISACLYICYLTGSGQTYNLWAECLQHHASQSSTKLMVIDRPVLTLQPGQATASSFSSISRLRKARKSIDLTSFPTKRPGLHSERLRD